MNVKKYFLKEPFIFDFSRFAGQTFSLVAVVVFICALFLFSGIFLDAAAEADRAETMPAVVHDFIEITPFNTVTATSWDNLRLQVNSAGATPTTINVPTMTSLGAADANAIVIPANANITIRSTLPATNNVITQATANQRHFTVNGSLTLENVIICGGSVGTFTEADNEPDIRGGIHVAGANGHLILTDGALLRNNTADFGGGVHVASPASLTMTGGAVNQNAAMIHGGGVYLTGANATLDMRAGQINQNRVAGMQLFSAQPTLAQFPLPPWTWLWPGDAGGENENAIYGARWDFPQGQSRGGGGLAIRAGATADIRTLAGTTAQSAEIRGNFAERGGGVYVTGTNSRLNLTNAEGLVADNRVRHAYHRLNSSSTLNGLPANQQDGLPLSVADARVSGAGGGVHVAAGARFDMTTGHITSNIAIAQFASYGAVAGAGGGGGGVTVIGNGSTFNMSGNATINLNRNSSAGSGGGNTITLLGGNETFHRIPPALGSTGTALGAGAGVRVAMGATMLMEDTAAVVSNHNGNSAMGGGIAIQSASVEMRDDARIASNTVGYAGATAAGGRGGGVALIGGTFTMHDTAHIAYNRVGSGQFGGGAYVGAGTFTMRDETAVRNHNVATGAGNILQGAGINATGGRIEMFDQASVHTNTAAQHGGGIRLQAAPAWATGVTADLVMNDSSTVRNNTASNGNGGGVLVEGTNAATMNDDSAIRNNTATNGNGGGVHVASTATGDNGRYGLRINSGSITDNTATGAAPNGRGGGIFTTRHLYRSPLVNNPLLDPPFSNAAYTIYDNLRIADAAIFANNNARFISGPPTGDQLAGAQLREGYIANVNPSVAANISGANNRLLNNLDINYNFDGHDFWFYKEDMAGNPLPGVTFELRQPNGQVAQGSPAGTPAGTADGQRVSLSNGLVGFPRAMNTFGAASNYSLSEISGPAGIIIPNGNWSFNIPNRFVRNTIGDTAVLSATNVSAITRSNDTMPDFFTRGTDGEWRVFNANVATKSFFKTDMSIYDTPPNASPPVLEGAIFRLYRYTPQSASTAFAGAVPAPGQLGYNYWTHIPVTVSAAHLYTLNFGAWNVPVEHFGPAAKFHLVETVAPANFELPPGQWRFLIEPDALGLEPVITITSQGGTNPEFRQIGTNWFVGNAEEHLLIPTGLVLQNSRVPFFIIIGGAVVFITARLAVRHRKNIEELSKLP